MNLCRLPKRVTRQHSKASKAEWKNLVTMLWKFHNGMSQQHAIIQYVKNAEDLGMFGISYFKIFNDRCTEYLLGIDAFGLNVYAKFDKLIPSISFAWSEISRVEINGFRFTIDLSNQKYMHLYSRDPTSARE